MASDSSNSQQTPDQEIENLAQEIGRLIKRADPERREDLKELAYTLIRQEAFETAAGRETAGAYSPGPFNPLGIGVLLFVLGGGLSFIFGPVGLLLMAGGILFVVWGFIISWAKR